MLGIIPVSEIISATTWIVGTLLGWSTHCQADNERHVIYLGNGSTGLAGLTAESVWRYNTSV